MQIVEIRPGIFACLMANETANAGFVVTEWIQTNCPDGGPRTGLIYCVRTWRGSTTNRSPR